jgi:hypothetical protein
MKNREKKPLVKTPGEAEAGSRSFALSNGYSRSVARLVGRERDQPSLFTMQGLLKVEDSHREVISKNAVILGDMLFSLLPSDTSKLTITNLAPFTELFNVNNHEIKLYFLALGGFTYPVTKLKEGRLGLSNEQFFKITIWYDTERIEAAERGEIRAVGTDYTHLLLNEPHLEIEVEPNPNFLDDIKGHGQRFSLKFEEKYFKLCLQLSDLAYKFTQWSGTQRRSHSIKEQGLINALSLAAQVKKQGAPRIRAAIHKALEELKTHGYLTEYSYNEETGLYKWVCSGEYIQHGKLGAATEPGIE